MINVGQDFPKFHVFLAQNYLSTHVQIHQKSQKLRTLNISPLLLSTLPGRRSHRQVSPLSMATPIPSHLIT